MTSDLRVDCHIHSFHSGDARTPLPEIEEAAVRSALDVVCITDHGTTRGGEEAAATFERVRVVVGQECRTYAGEIIGLFLNERIPGNLKPAEVIAAIRAQGGIVYLPHPFCRDHNGLTPAMAESLAAEIDVVEIHNAKATPEGNTLAAAFASSHKIPGAAASDAHYAEFVGRAYVEMPEFNDAQGFLAALADPAARIEAGTYSHAEAIWPKRVG